MVSGKSLYLIFHAIIKPIRKNIQLQSHRFTLYPSYMPWVIEASGPTKGTSCGTTCTFASHCSSKATPFLYQALLALCKTPFRACFHCICCRATNCTIEPLDANDTTGGSPRHTLPSSPHDYKKNTRSKSSSGAEYTLCMRYDGYQPSVSVCELRVGLIKSAYRTAGL